MGTVTATPEALDLIAEIVADHGPVMFHQSGGCCDGSSPMCYPLGEFLVGDYDVKMGEIGGAPFYISGSQYEAWKHTDLIIDVVQGRGGMFSLDNGRERRFPPDRPFAPCRPPPARLAVELRSGPPRAWLKSRVIGAETPDTTIVCENRKSVRSCPWRRIRHRRPEAKLSLLRADNSPQAKISVTAHGQARQTRQAS